MGRRADFAQVEIASREAWRSWLQAHHQQSESIWLVTYKAKTGSRHVSYKDIVEEALCFGWIDSQPRRLDEARSMRLLSPRRRGSAWSKANRARAERLIANGTMTAAGLAKIEQAKSDGSWIRLRALDSLESLADLDEALERYPPARARFLAFPPSARRSIMEWILQARRPETRRRRVEETARLAADGVRANQARQPRAVRT